MLPTTLLPCLQDTIQLARVDPHIISKIKKAERKASNGRLMDPLTKKKQEEAEAGPMAAGVSGSTAAGTATTSSGSAAAAPSASAAAAAASSSSSSATGATTMAAKPSIARMMEDMEAQRYCMMMMNVDKL
jgi:hypothetical protein